MTAHLVETSEEDSFTAVASFIAGLFGDGEAKTMLADTPASRFTAEAEALLAEGRMAEFVGAMAGQLDTVFSKASASDAECCLAVLVHLIPRIEDEEVLVKAARNLAQALAVQPQVMGDVKLNALVSLYSACPSPVAQYHALMSTVEFAKQDRALAASLAPAVRGKAEEWQRQWGLPEGMARDLFLALAGMLKVVGDKASHKEYLKLLTAALGLGTNPTDPALKAAAVAAVTDFVASPDVYQCDFWELPAVQQLAKDAAHAPLLKLLGSMLAGDLKAFRAAATPEVLHAANITESAAEEKMRLMALLVLGGRCTDEHRPATFTEIQQALDIPESQVQLWLVNAIGRKLMDGKIDQVAGTVAISRCHHRAFVSSEWARLEQQLAAWQSSLETVAQTMAQQDGAGTRHGGDGARPPVGVRA